MSDRPIASAPIARRTRRFFLTSAVESVGACQPVPVCRDLSDIGHRNLSPSRNSRRPLARSPAPATVPHSDGSPISSWRISRAVERKIGKNRHSACLPTVWHPHDFLASAFWHLVERTSLEERKTVSEPAGGRVDSGQADRHQRPQFRCSRSAEVAPNTAGGPCNRRGSLIGSSPRCDLCLGGADIPPLHSMICVAGARSLARGDGRFSGTVGQRSSRKVLSASKIKIGCGSSRLS